MSVLRGSGLTVEHRLSAVDLVLEPGELVGVIGPNGAGKSTLLSVLAGLQPLAQGVVTLDQQPLESLPARQRARQIGYLAQSGHSAWALQVEDIVAMGRLPWGDADACAIAQALRDSGAEALRGRRIDALSGGEQARVWLARVLAGQPQLLLADEPVASLDLYYQRAVMQTLRGFADSGRSALVALHDLALAARYCDRLLLLADGRLHAAGSPAQVLQADLLQAVYGLPVQVDLQAQPPHISFR
ncbi:ABC transporter [Stenotrophomonas koreensis]|uniref:ABC transporter n=1 Tax=Stenotrophomonas koreensis TaxID=266128 RepID=A0A0R0BKR4_9GAMM|nr:ABC transporter ATP-binding protein [Stenotrophomonas koreensis]KRG57839.1 ABC transporter [Stenotrophomonas koreensis]